MSGRCEAGALGPPGRIISGVFATIKGETFCYFPSVLKPIRELLVTIDAEAVRITCH
jgi:hypothetical protein